MYDKELTLEEHLEMANDLAITCHILDKMFYKIQEKYGKSHKISKLLYKLVSNKTSSSIFNCMKSELDNEYLRGLSDENFKKYGFIYYKLEERYKKMRLDKKCPKCGKQFNRLDFHINDVSKHEYLDKKITVYLYCDDCNLNSIYEFLYAYGEVEVVNYTSFFKKEE